jgi:hypothetical protein
VTIKATPAVNNTKSVAPVSRAIRENVSAIPITASEVLQVRCRWGENKIKLAELCSK